MELDAFLLSTPSPRWIFSMDVQDRQREQLLQHPLTHQRLPISNRNLPHNNQDFIETSNEGISLYQHINLQQEQANRRSGVTLSNGRFELTQTRGKGKEKCTNERNNEEEEEEEEECFTPYGPTLKRKGNIRFVRATSLTLLSTSTTTCFSHQAVSNRQKNEDESFSLRVVAPSTPTTDTALVSGVNPNGTNPTFDNEKDTDGGKSEGNSRMESGNKVESKGSWVQSLYEKIVGFPNRFAGSSSALSTSSKSTITQKSLPCSVISTLPPHLPPTSSTTSPPQSLSRNAFLDLVMKEDEDNLSEIDLTLEDEESSTEFSSDAEDQESCPVEFISDVESRSTFKRISHSSKKRNRLVKSGMIDLTRSDDDSGSGDDDDDDAILFVQPTPIPFSSQPRTRPRPRPQPRSRVDEGYFKDSLNRPLYLQPRPAPLILPIHQLLSRPEELIEQPPIQYGLKPSNIGWKLLCKQGWREGEGLGPRPNTLRQPQDESTGEENVTERTINGLRVPLKASDKMDRRGLGAFEENNRALTKRQKMEMKRRQDIEESDQRRFNERGGKTMRRRHKRDQRERKAMMAYMNN